MQIIGHFGKNKVIGAHFSADKLLKLLNANLSELKISPAIPYSETRNPGIEESVVITDSEFPLGVARKVISIENACPLGSVDMSLFLEDNLPEEMFISSAQAA